VAVSIDPHGDDVLTRATELLRQHTDAGWTAISADILHRAMAAFRPSEPVRGRHESGDFFVASTVIVSQLRHVVDQTPHAAATRITSAETRAARTGQRRTPLPGPPRDKQK